MSQLRRSVEIDERREAVACYLSQGYTLRAIAVRLFCTVMTVHRDKLWLKAQEEEFREGQARLYITLKRNGHIEELQDRTLTDAIRRMERRIVTRCN